MTLRGAEAGKDYRVLAINTDDEELDAFLLSLGCYKGQAVTVVNTRRSGCVITIKDGRYNIDKYLADAIEVEEIKK